MRWNRFTVHLSIAVTVAIGLGACRQQEAAQEERAGAKEESTGTQEEAGALKAGAFYFKDTVDGGDDPFNPGCEEVFLAAGCPGLGRVARGDRCSDAITLLEGTDQNCHQGDVVTTYNCDELCRKNGHDAGTCGPIDSACAGFGSATCVCQDEMEKQTTEQQQASPRS